MAWLNEFIAQVEREKISLPIHEAGHACAAILCGRKFEFMTLEPYGHYKEKYKAFVSGIERRGDLDDAVISYAGICAEKIKFGRWPYAEEGGHIDKENAIEAINRIYGPNASSVIHREALEKAERLLTLNWEKVLKVAKALTEKRLLRFDEVNEIMK